MHLALCPVQHFKASGSAFRSGPAALVIAGSYQHHTIRSGLFLCDLIRHSYLKDIYWLQTKSNWHLGDLYYYRVVFLSCLSNHNSWI